MSSQDKVLNEESDSLVEEVISVRRCTKVVKGGRRFSFSAYVVVGDKNGTVGLGKGKAGVVRDAIQKARKKAVVNMQEMSIRNDTVPHEVIGKACTSKVIIIPARPGTGVTAGASVRAVLESVGIANVLTKVYGSKNPINVARAAINGLEQLRTKEEVEKLRGVKCDEYE